MSNQTQPWFGAARRLTDRRTDSYGLAVDKDGVTLGPDFALVRKTARGYEPATAEELSCLREVATLRPGDTQRLAHHLETIAKALTTGDIAKARILSLHFPINRVTPGQVDRLRKASAILKQFNPDEPRDERGRWTTGSASASSSSAPSGAQTRGLDGIGRPMSIHPGVRRVQEIVPFEPEVPLEPQFEEEFSPPGWTRWRVDRKECEDAAERTTLENPWPWERICNGVPRRWKRVCWEAANESVQNKKGICAAIFPKELTDNVQY